jgi:hypothetical protein
MLHECKLNFLRIISDHDLFVELPGRDPTERYRIRMIGYQQSVYLGHIVEITYYSRLDWVGD